MRWFAAGWPPWISKRGYHHADPGEHTTTEHVRRVVYRHDWTDIQDWAARLQELATFTDEQIEMLVRDEPGELFVFEEDVPLGVTPSQAKADRALFEQCTADDISA